MSKFWIEKLTVSGKSEPSSITFTNGLNIIQGPSNTGKTYIFNAIEYCLGKSKEPFDNDGVHTNFELVIGTNNGKITVTRKLGQRNSFVSSEISTIKPGKYPSKENKENLSQLLLRLLGIDSSPKVIKNKTYERSTLGFRMIAPFFIIDETKIQSEMPIFIPSNPTIRTQTLSALSYLITGDELADEDKVPSDKEIRIQKNAIKEFVVVQQDFYEQEISSLRQEFDKLDKQLNGITAEEIINQLDSVETQLINILNRDKTLISKIEDLKNKRKEMDILIEQYDELYSQYTADIQRLTFIIDSHNKFNDITHLKECPICQSKTSHSLNDSILESSKAELSNIIGLLTSLKTTYNSISEDREITNSQILSLTSTYNDEKELMNTTLKPNIIELKKQLNDINRYNNLSTQIEVISSALVLLQEKSNEFSKNAKEKHKSYNAHDTFPETFEKDMNTILSNILKKTNYEQFKTVTFSNINLGLTINNMSNSDFGKGRRSFNNACLVLGLREYLNRYGAYCPGFLMIDSPLTTFYEGNEENTPDSMKRGLLMYLIESQKEGQTIIIENEPPKIDYEAHNVNIIKFTKDEKKGRYGFLLDVIN